MEIVRIVAITDMIAKVAVRNNNNSGFGGNCLL